MTSSRMDMLQEIIDSLPSAENPPKERRSNALTKGDVMIIYKIASIANEPHVCPFEGDDATVLHNVARNITRTQKIASGVIITGIVGGILTGVWAIVTYAIKQFISNGGINTP